MYMANKMDHMSYGCRCANSQTYSPCSDSAHLSALARSTTSSRFARPSQGRPARSLVLTMMSPPHAARAGLTVAQ